VGRRGVTTISRPAGTSSFGPYTLAFHEPYTLLLPGTIDPTRRLVMYAHGANGSNIDAINATSKGIPAALFALAQAGFVVLSMDFGGSQNYGNATALAATEQAWTDAKATGLCATDKFLADGASMGALTMHRHAKEHPADVAGMTFWIPFVSIEPTRTANTLGVRDLYNTAWGLPAGSYVGGADSTPAPLAGNPLLYAASMAAIPTHLWYSTADPISSDMAAYLAARGSSAVGHVVSTTDGHTDTTILAADVPSIVAFHQSLER
jgi:alpha-beta hydrolase superfamily lysophospholipase